jgi:hypothetical protein
MGQLLALVTNMGPMETWASIMALFSARAWRLLRQALAPDPAGPRDWSWVDLTGRPLFDPDRRSLPAKEIHSRGFTPTIAGS